MRLRIIRYLKAFTLFEQKKYEESMDLFSSVSATPNTIIRLFPSIIAGDLAIHEESDEQESKSSEHGDASPLRTASPPISRTVPDLLRASLDSQRRPKDAESDSASIVSKHTVISLSGPPGLYNLWSQAYK